MVMQSARHSSYGRPRPMDQGPMLACHLLQFSNSLVCITLPRIQILRSSASGLAFEPPGLRKLIVVYSSN